MHPQKIMRLISVTPANSDKTSSEQKADAVHRIIAFIHASIFFSPDANIRNRKTNKRNVIIT